MLQNLKGSPHVKSKALLVLYEYIDVLSGFGWDFASSSMTFVLMRGSEVAERIRGRFLWQV